MNRHQKTSCAQKRLEKIVFTLLGSIVNIIRGGDLYDHLMSMGVCTLLMCKV